MVNKDHHGSSKAKTLLDLKTSDYLKAGKKMLLYFSELYGVHMDSLSQKKKKKPRKKISKGSSIKRAENLATGFIHSFTSQKSVLEILNKQPVIKSAEGNKVLPPDVFEFKIVLIERKNKYPGRGKD